MAVSSPKHDETSSSRSSTLQETHEQTPLLESSGYTSPSNASTGYAASTVVSEDATSVSEVDGAKKDQKIGVGIVGVISVLLLGTLLANADMSIVIATYSTISSEFESLENASWLVLTYSLSLCAIQPTYGKLSDIYGRKATLIAAYILFTLGCALCGVGATFWQVILGRVIAGLGGAGMTSLVSIVIADKVPLRDIATWRSYVNIASTVGRSAGGPIGGFLADTIGWRWSFLLQCPLTLVAIALVTFKLNYEDRSLPLDVKKPSRSKLHRIDFMGSLSLALAIVGFLLVLDLGGQKLPWGHPAIWGILASSAVTGLLFLLVEGYVAKEPIFPLQLLFHRDVVTAYILVALQVTAQFGMMYTIPSYFQVTENISLTNAGVHLVPTVVGNAIGGVLSGIIIKRTASYKLLTVTGALSSFACYLLLVLRWRGNTSFWESLYIVPGGFGTAIVQNTTFVALAAGVAESQMAIASTGLYLSTNIGLLIGASVTSKVLQASLRSGLDVGLRGFPDRKSITANVLSDMNYIQKLHGKVKEIVFETYVDSYTNAHYVSLGCSVLATLVSLFLREHELE